MEDKRISWLDIAKGIGIYFIVLGHTMSDPSIPGCGILHEYLYSFHVPFFFILAGLTAKCGKRGFGDFLIKKLKTLIIPYLVFGILSIIIFRLAEEFIHANLAHSDGDYSIGNNFVNLVTLEDLQFNRPLWFLPCLFLMELLTWPLLKWEHSLWGRENYLFRTFAFLLMGVLSWLVAGHLWPLDIQRFQVEVAMLPYLFAGILLAPILKIPFKKPHIRLLTLTAGFALIGLGIWLWGLCSVHYNREIGFLIFSPFTSVVALISSLGYIALCAAILTCRPIEYVGQASLLIMCLHKFPVVFFQTCLPFTAVLLAEMNYIAGTTVALICLLLCVGSYFFIFRFCPAILGRFSSRPQNTKIISKFS